MKPFLPGIILVAVLAGCTTMRQADIYALEQKKKLTLAKMLLENNKPVAAKKTLAKISTEPPVPGVTDEALFRLALLDLEAGKQKISTEKAGKDLDTLLTLFGSSPWSTHAVTLKGMLEAYTNTLQEKAELEKTVRNLKNANTSLVKENAELRQGLEKLKKLDLELEMKKKR